MNRQRPKINLILLCYPARRGERRERLDEISVSIGRNSDCMVVPTIYLERQTSPNLGIRPSDRFLTV